MSGFDNGTTQSGVFFQTKQFGAIMRGFGPPVPQSGVVGDVYIDVQTWFLYSKRSPDAGGDVDPWGHYLFQVPVTYRTALKWFSAYAPTDDVGIANDYCLLWGGWTNYGLQPSIFGPKQATSWPENGNGPDTTIAAAGAGTTLQVGLVDEGLALAESNSTQLIVVGLVDEYILGIPVTAGAGSIVSQLGLQSGPANIAVSLNPQYAAEDTNIVPNFTNIVPGEQNNVSIAVASHLTVPATATYAIVTAVGGTMYATYDNSVPSNVNYAIAIAAGTSLPVTGTAALAAIRVQGSSMSVSYWN